MKRKLQIENQVLSDAITVSIIGTGNKVVLETGVSPELAFADVLRIALKLGGRLNVLSVTFPTERIYEEFTKTINREINNKK